MNILIAGYGFVGQAHEAALKDKYNIIIHDPNLGYDANYQKVDAVIVCVSTPQADNGSCYADNVIDVVSKTDINTPILVKSTISIEGWQRLKELYPEHKLAFSPEFLRAASAIEDFLSTRQMYIGGDEVGFWHALFRVAFGDPTFTTQVALPEELILTKYFRNSFLATKVAFFNQVYDLCNALNIDYETVSHMVAEDARIGQSHTQVTDQRGFGGHCFPKDTAAIAHTADLMNVDLTLIKEAVKYNKSIRKLS